MKKTVLVTGSTSGIGKAIAEGFAQLGYNIIFNGIDENGETIAGQIASQYGVGYHFSNANLLDTNALSSLVHEVKAKFGQVDILINNAGIQYVSPVASFPEEKWHAIIGLNLTAPFLLIKAFWEGMKNQQFGRIINIASAHGLVASENKSAYVASKHGILGLTKTVALEGAPFNITCNAVCPGYVYTPIIEGQIENQMMVNNMSKEEVIKNVMLSKQAIKEFIPVELIVQAVLFLAADNARAITGIALPVEGGWTAQ